MGFFDSIRRFFASGDMPASTPVPPPVAEPVASIVATEPLAFPYPLVTVHGRDALATWNRLRGEDGGWPVVLGGDEDVASIREGIEDLDDRSPDAILAIADGLTFPASLVAHHEDQDRRTREWLREQGRADRDEERPEPPIGEWPTGVTPTGFTVASDILTGQFHDRVHIAILPCKTGWEAMAFLRWGGWNDNPSAEYHVAALREWNAAFGAELVGCSRDVINLHVATRPFTREAAMQLARDQYLYCTDLVEQGSETFAGLAAALMADDWWYFWWD
ncbi:DUF4253 domain-containing protein [Sphingomonas sp. CFBP 13728]|uniref:DUF4253 domain-containing protein n=1 Tax=Sphingomonas sp. CFBP 13728 TaxID=2775294 RepID=UPI00177E64BA|nr:DUF4253 domain-containing protein [Sphingomonas sp. CFBP 13728]MBD8620372.1 DUF4253 domain-containing protein [Sphingomonas sp. CFBP 13728]